MKKDVEIQFDEDCYTEFTKLQRCVIEDKKSKKPPSYSQLLSSINVAIHNIKANPTFGDLIPRAYIPKKTITKYGTDKIFRVELVGYWRMLYTLVGDEAKIIAFILDYMNHNKYNKAFNYKKR